MIMVFLFVIMSIPCALIIIIKNIRLKKLNFICLVITNQPEVSRGKINKNTVIKMNNFLINFGSYMISKILWIEFGKLKPTFEKIIEGFCRNAASMLDELLMDITKEHFSIISFDGTDQCNNFTFG